MNNESAKSSNVVSLSERREQLAYEWTETEMQPVRGVVAASEHKLSPTRNIGFTEVEFIVDHEEKIGLCAVGWISLDGAAITTVCKHQGTYTMVNFKGEIIWQGKTFEGLMQVAECFSPTPIMNNG